MYIYKKQHSYINFFNKTNKKQTHQLFAAKLQTIFQYFNKPVLLLILLILLILQDRSI